LEFFWCSVFVLILFGLCFLLTYGITLYDPKEKTVLQTLTRAQRLEIADIFFSIPVYVVFVVLATVATVELSGDVFSRWQGVTTTSKYFLVLYVTRIVFHFPIQAIVLQNSPLLHLQMIFHHLLTILCCGVALVTYKMHFFGNFLGCCELTTVFLNFLFMLKWLSPQTSVKHFLANFICGLSLWFSFISHRLVLFPLSLWWMYVDVATHPTKTWDVVTNYERYLHPSMALVLLALSTTWFVPITKGVIKGLRSIGGEKVKKKA